MWYIHAMEYYPTTFTFVEMQMNLEPVIQGQKEKNKHRILTHVCLT